jgi:site-specific DNA-cytosine methylase
LVFHEVQADLEAAGYEVWPYVLPAVSVGAPHRRDRVWFVAYAKDFGSPISKLGEKESGKQIQAGGNINGHESMGLTPHPDRNGLNQRNGNDEEQPGKRWFNALGNADTGNEYGDAADTDNKIKQQKSGNNRWKSSKQKQNDRDKVRDNASSICSYGPTTHPNRIRLEQCEDSGEMGRRQAEMGGQGREFTNAIEADGKVADAADTESLRINREAKHENRDRQGRKRGRCDADNFGEIQGRIAIADSMLPRGRKDNGRGESKIL